MEMQSRGEPYSSVEGGDLGTVLYATGCDENDPLISPNA
jgi:hypothetical protein